MRSRFVSLLLLLSTLVVAGCTSGDPNLEKPCDQRTPREVEVGVGDETFHSIGGEVQMDSGSQGGNHIWMAVRTQNLGPTVTVSYGVVDPDTDSSFSEEHLKQIVELEYTGEANEAAGLQAFLKDEFVSQLPGRKVRLWAEVSDECGVYVLSHADATVSVPR